MKDMEKVKKQINNKKSATFYGSCTFLMISCYVISS